MTGTYSISINLSTDKFLSPQCSTREVLSNFPSTTKSKGFIVSKPRRWLINLDRSVLLAPPATVYSRLKWSSALGWLTIGSSGTLNSSGSFVEKRTVSWTSSGVASICGIVL